jgi:gamma-glutamyltranspeptidase/glutathione hydrolase
VTQPRRGAVATPHSAATDAAVDAFSNGGNAIDAALSAAVALTVAYPHATSIGGDLIALVRQPDGAIDCINASGPAARGVDVGAVRDRHGATMPESGADTVTVPGAVAGLAAIHELGAAREWSDHLVAATTLAADGVPVARDLAAAISEEQQQILADPGLAQVFAPGEQGRCEGDLLRQPALAETLRTLASGGAEAFYRGPVAASLTAELAGRGSALSTADFADFQPTREAPLRLAYRDHDVWTSGPNTQGFVLLEVLGALAAMPDDIAPLGRDAGMLSDLFAAGILDRDEHLADPAAMTVTVEELLDPQRLAALAAAARVGRTGINEARRVTRRPKGDTVAVATADSDGRAVCLIQSLFYGFGAGILDPATGIVLHNRGSLFSLTPGSPNCLAPGRRPAHTLMPTMVTAGGRLRWVVGTMGGMAQPQIIAQVMLRLFAGGSAQDAVSAPRWVVGGLDLGQPTTIGYLESRLATDARESIASRMSTSMLGAVDDSTGHSQAVAVADDGELSAGSDPRSDGRAASV